MRLLASLVFTTSMMLFIGFIAPARATTAPAPAQRGAWPLAPRPEIVSGFDPPEEAWGAGHRGVDLLGHPGQPVRTALGGTVTFAGRLAGRGVVVVDHGDVRTTYEPVSADVKVGQQVGRGERIGTLQRASSHCFPRTCLHWGLLRGETYLDPLTLVGAGPIRLLPLAGGPGLAPAFLEPAGLSTATSMAPSMAPSMAESVRPMPVGEPAGRPGAAVPW
jgi:murein DD-endopeptidase MepM/ murein hydrolase activator NlpD